jgi:hypothetical protein
MNVRRSAPVSSRPQTTSPTNLLTASTTGWYARWKARKAAEAPAPVSEPEPAPPADGADELARWLAGDTGK